MKITHEHHQTRLQSGDVIVTDARSHQELELLRDPPELLWDCCHIDSKAWLHHHVLPLLHFRGDGMLAEEGCANKLLKLTRSQGQQLIHVGFVSLVEVRSFDRFHHGLHHLITFKNLGVEELCCMEFFGKT